MEYRTSPKHDPARRTTMIEDGSISTAARRCATLYDRLYTGLKESTTLASISPSDCSDELGRFRIWANNIGALLDASSAASLDMRLKDASRVKRRILETLQDLYDSLEDVIEIISGQRPNRRKSTGEESVGQTIFELDELFNSAKDCVTSLMKLSVALRSATTRDRYLKAENSALFPLSNEWDIAHVAQKFPKVNATPWLKQRLGAAITKRRQFLLYCQHHHEQMQEKPLERAPTVKTTTKASTLALERLEQPNVDAESYASAATSYGIDEDETETALRVPPLNDITGTFPFECPLCLGMQEFTTEPAWRKHVFRDLRPYVCTFEKCDVKLFESRHAWFNHELDHHRQQWKCKSCNHDAFTTKSLFVAHAVTHLPSANSDQLDQLAKASREPVRAFEATCPICDGDILPHRNALESLHPSNSNVSMQQLRRHLGRHMEQLALFALPKSFMKTDDGSSGSSVVSQDGKLAIQDGELILWSMVDESRLSFEERVQWIISKLAPTETPTGINFIQADPMSCRIRGSPENLKKIRDMAYTTEHSSAYREVDGAQHRQGEPLRPIHFRVKKKYIDPGTLDVYQLPWEFDANNPDSVIIKTFLNQDDQEILYQHTRRLREERQRDPNAFLPATATIRPEAPTSAAEAASRLSRPTYLRIKRKYLALEVLDMYDLPWEPDDSDSRYIIIKQWMNEDEQERLFKDSLEWLQREQPETLVTLDEDNTNFQISGSESLAPVSPKLFATPTDVLESEHGTNLVPENPPTNPRQFSDVNSSASSLSLGEREDYITEESRHFVTNEHGQAVEVCPWGDCNRKFYQLGERDHHINSEHNGRVPETAGQKEATGGHGKNGSERVERDRSNIDKETLEDFFRGSDMLAGRIAPKIGFEDDNIEKGVDQSPAGNPPKSSDIPANARWTKISRQLVNIEALESKRERFEVRDDHIIVLRPLSKDEIGNYAELTKKIREQRDQEGEFRESNIEEEDVETRGPRDRSRDRSRAQERQISPDRSGIAESTSGPKKTQKSRSTRYRSSTNRTEDVWSDGSEGDVVIERTARRLRRRFFPQ